MSSALGPCVMCKANESIAVGFSPASCIKHVLVYFAQGGELYHLVESLCSKHKREYSETFIAKGLLG